MSRRRERYSAVRGDGIRSAVPRYPPRISRKRVARSRYPPVRSSAAAESVRNAAVGWTALSAPVRRRRAAHGLTRRERGRVGRSGDLGGEEGSLSNASILDQAPGDRCPRRILRLAAMPRDHGEARETTRAVTWRARPVRERRSPGPTTQSCALRLCARSLPTLEPAVEHLTKPREHIAPPLGRPSSVLEADTPREVAADRCACGRRVLSRGVGGARPGGFGQASLRSMCTSAALAQQLGSVPSCPA
jgi:hypothetical protein